jgi:hypothetical protein
VLLSLTMSNTDYLFLLRCRGKYVTQADVEARVQQMEATRHDMMERLENEEKTRRMGRKERMPATNA